MYISRLTFHTLPGCTDEVQTRLHDLSQMVEEAGGTGVRVMRSHLASLGAPDVVFEQEAEDLASLESQIQQVAGSERFQEWSRMMSPQLQQSPKREIYLVS